MSTVDLAAWTRLAESLASPGREDAQTSFDDLFLSDEGYTKPDGSWRSCPHALEVRLCPWGIGNLHGPHGAAHCACTDWALQGWQTGRTPMLLPYPKLAHWLAAHATAANVPRVASLMSGVALLGGLNA